MFKTILKIAVLSATTITLLSACGAATKALNSAADDALNLALAKAEKRYEKRYTEAISNLTDDNGVPLKVYIDDDGNPFHLTIDENGDPIKVTIDDKINSIKAKTDDKGNPIQVTIDDNGNPIPVTIDDKSNPILTVATGPTTAEICSGKGLWELSEPPCDKDEASLQRRHERCLNDPLNYDCMDDRYKDLRTAKICLNNPFVTKCLDDDSYDNGRHEYCLKFPWYTSACTEDDRYDDARHQHCLNNPFDTKCPDDGYQNARLETCAVDFRYECANGGLEFYPALIQFCNNQANADHDSCRVASEPQIGSYGTYYKQFLQGTADGLNTGSLRASDSDATAPVVHILKLSDSDNGVAFFAGIAPKTEQRSYYYYHFYAGILPDSNLGAPITQTSGTAVWQGTFSVINSDTLASGAFRTDTDFELEIDFAEGRLSASINGVENNGVEKNKNLDSGRPWAYTDYRLSGFFADGKIEAELEVTEFQEEGSDDESEVSLSRVRGLIGQDGAIGAFIGGLRGSYSGGFVASPSSK